MQGRIPSASGQRESAANRRLETHGGKPKGGCGTECKPSPRQRLMRGRFFCFGHLMRVRPKEHASMSSSSQVVPSTPDVLVRNEGTVFLFCPLTSPRQTVDRGACPAGRSVVWERLGRRAPFRLGSRPRAEGCGIGAGMITDSGREERTTKRVALYARVSTVKHGEQLTQVS